MKLLSPVFALTLFAAPLCAQDVLIVTVDATGCSLANVKSTLDATGALGTVDTFDGGLATPTLATLQAYDAVLIFSDSGGFLSPVDMGNVLADYVDAGGGVVDGVFSAHPNLPIQGRWETGGYALVTATGQTQGTQEFLGPVLDPGHPVMQGVTSFDGGLDSYQYAGPVVTAAGTLIAQWSDGVTPLVVAGNNGQQVSLGFFPPNSLCRSSFWNPSTDGALLMVNALQAVSKMSLTGTAFVAGQAASLSVAGSTAFGPTAIAFSVAGGGPTSTPYGVADLSAPIRVLTVLTADLSGDAVFNFVVPAGASGGQIWLQALDLTAGRLSNGLYRPIS